MKTSYTARRLPVTTGISGWKALLKHNCSPRAPALSGAQTADFVIIGAGFAGLAAARRLTQLAPNASIHVLDALRIGEGGIGRNSGFMIDLPHELSSSDYSGSGCISDAEMIRLNRMAIDFARDAVEEYDINRHYFDPVGKINGAVSEKAHAHNLSYQRHLKQLGEDSECLDEKEMLAITGSRYYRSGLFTPGTVMLQPAGFALGMAQGLSRKVQFHEASPVSAFVRRGQDWVVITAQGQITTPRVILTTNGHIESFGVQQGRLMHVTLYATMTREMSDDELRRAGGQPRWGVTPSDPMGTTMRRIDSGQGGNRIITRTCATFDPKIQPRKGEMQRASQVMRRKFDERFPSLKGLPMEYAWAGQVCLTNQAVSVTGKIDEGVYSGAVQNGLGAARGTLTGIAAAEAACGFDSPISRAFCGESRPSRLPPPPLSTLGANAYLRFKEFRACKE